MRRIGRHLNRIFMTARVAAKNIRHDNGVVDKILRHSAGHVNGGRAFGLNHNLGQFVIISNRINHHRLPFLNQRPVVMLR